VPDSISLKVWLHMSKMVSKAMMIFEVELLFFLPRLLPIFIKAYPLSLLTMNEPDESFDLVSSNSIVSFKPKYDAIAICKGYFDFKFNSYDGGVNSPDPPCWIVLDLFKGFIACSYDWMSLKS